jgi:membrane protease YdiL (CAAX protease family)
MKGSEPGEELTASSVGGYLTASQRPLYILVFLLPLLMAYELGALLYLSGGESGPTTIAAWGMLSRFFEAFGVVGLHLPAVLLVTVLLTWHMLQRDPWRIRPGVLVGMAMEACLWTVPLTILLILIGSAFEGPGPTDVPPMVQTLSPGEAASADIRQLPWQARLTISAGAGLYEELLFRMILIAAAHTVVVDLLRLSSRAGGVIAVGVSAVAFAAYHQVSAGGGVGLGWAVPYLAAGIYFGVLYLARGFGLVVAVHFLYDVVALLASG